jgi:hypothetical protein
MLTVSKNQVRTKLFILKSWGSWHLSRSWGGTERLVFLYKGEQWLYTVYADQINSEVDVSFWMDFFKRKLFLAPDDFADLEVALHYLLTREPVR